MSRRDEILAVWGFEDVGLKARTRGVRDWFISGQRNCGLRCHLDNVPSDMPIWDIVDRCRVWESHTDKDRRPPPGTNVGQMNPAVASNSRESSFYMDGSSRVATSPAFEPEGLASRVSNACSSTDTGGGGLAAATSTNKPDLGDAGAEP